MPLTRRQQEVLDFLRNNAENFEHPPTLDELCRMLGLASRGSLHKHIQALVEAGLVEPLDGRHRGIRLVSQVPDEQTVPFLGKIAAGRPIEAVPQPEYMEVPPQLRTDRPCYVLQVQGDSMIEAGILDGDYVVIRSQQDAANGEIVAALVDGEEATVKRFERAGDTVRLISENPAYAPMVFEDGLQLIGKVVAVLRAVR